MIWVGAERLGEGFNNLVGGLRDLVGGRKTSIN